MKRTTVSLPDDLALVIEREARRRAISISELTREALERHVAPPAGRHRLSFAGIGKGDGTVAAENMEEHLAREWSEHIGVRERSDPGDR